MNKPASDSDLAKAEKRIGRPLPDTLRDLYKHLGNGARFYWTPRADAAEVFGVEDLKVGRGGTFELFSLAKLRRIEDTDAWLFSSDGSSDGFAIDYSGEQPEVAWYTHDDEPVSEYASDFATWFHDFVAAGFTNEDDPLHGLLESYLAGKRTLPPKPPVASPEAPAANVKRVPFVRLQKLKSQARAIVILDDTRVVLGCDSGGVWIFDLRSGKPLGNYRTSLVLSLRASPSGATSPRRV